MSTDHQGDNSEDLTDESQLGEMLSKYRARLRRMVQLRLDRRLQGRIDASDVLQDAFLDVNRRFEEYMQTRTMPFFVWVRFLVGQKILETHRRHLNVKARDAAREVSIYVQPMPQASSVYLAAQLAGGLTGPSEHAIRAEMQVRLQDALDQMDEIDREILALRHFEQLTMAESASVLDIKLTAACNRYVRALQRLKEQLPEELKGQFS